MAFDGSLWGRRVQATGQTPVATATGFVALFTLDNFQGTRNEIVNGGSNSALNGGGDIRVSTDDAGANQLPLEIVQFTVSATPSLQEIQFWVRFPTYEAANRAVWVFYNRAGQTQPPVTDQFGRNSVWQDFQVVIHQGTVIDSTGNNTPVLNGSPSLVNMMWGGQGYALTNASDNISIPHSPSLNIEKDYSLTVWNDTQNLTGTQTLVFKSVNNSTGFRAFKKNVNVTRHRLPNLSPSNLNTSLNFGLGRDDMNFDGVTRRTKFNSVLQGSDNPTGTVTNNTDDILIGANNTNPASLIDSLGGTLGELWLAIPHRDHETEDLEYNNQNSPGTFWTMGEPEDTGGSAGITATITEAGPSFTESIIASATGNVSVSITEAGPSFSENINATLTSLVINADITETGPSFTEAISVTVTPSVGINAAITEIGPSFTESISAELQRTLSVDITETGPSFNESINANIIKSIDASITESGPSFTESITVRLPTFITVNPSNVVRVKKDINSVKVGRNINTIKVK